MPFIEYPDVPEEPGVPDVPRLSGDTVIDQEFNTFGDETPNLQSFKTTTKWGIYDADGNPLGDPNLFAGNDPTTSNETGAALSTLSLEFSKKMRISDFPVEQGTFANYNKVELPAVPVVTLVYGGAEADRSEFLRQIEVATDVTDLYSIVTPEVTYINFSVEGYDYERRNEKGANLLAVRLTLKQIRQVSAQFTSSNEQIRDPKEDSADPEINNGKIQSTEPDDATKKAVTKKYPGVDF